MKQKIRKAFYTLIVAVLVFAFFNILHEFTHGIIYGNFGCENVTYGYKNQFFYTNCTDEGFRCSEACMVAQSNNEIVGYTVMPFVLMILCMMLLRFRKVIK